MDKNFNDLKNNLLYVVLAIFRFEEPSLKDIQKLLFDALHNLPKANSFSELYSGDKISLENACYHLREIDTKSSLIIAKAIEDFLGGWSEH